MSCLRIVCISDTHGQHVKLRVRDVPAGNKTIAGRTHNAQVIPRAMQSVISLQ
jgi:hypothetical protein